MGKQRCHNYFSIFQDAARGKVDIINLKNMFGRFLFEKHLTNMFQMGVLFQYPIEGRSATMLFP